MKKEYEKVYTKSPLSHEKKMVDEWWNLDDDSSLSKFGPSWVIGIREASVRRLNPD